eukprot:scaffold1223_cov200-Alexandrium_tamarense.AAC.9
MAISPSFCDKRCRWYLGGLFSSRSASYQTDPVRYTPELFGVVDPRALRNVVFPAPVWGGEQEY